MALLVRPVAPRGAVVGGPQFLARLFRALVLGFRGLARTSPAVAAGFKTILAWPCDRGLRSVHPHRGSNGSRAISRPVLVVGCARGTDRSVLRMEPVPGFAVSLGVSVSPY